MGEIRTSISSVAEANRADAPEADHGATRSKLFEQTTIHGQSESPVHLFEAREQASFIEEGQNEATREIEECVTQLRQVIGGFDALVEHIDTAAKTALSNLGIRLEEQEAKSQDLGEPDGRVEHELKPAPAEDQAMSDEVRALRTICKKLEQIIVHRENLMQQVQELTGRLDASETSKNAVEQDLAASEKVKSDLHEAVEDLKHKHTIAEAALRDLCGKLEEQEARSQDLGEANSRLEDELETVTAKNQAISDEVQDLRAARDEFEQVVVQRKDLTQQVQELTGRLGASETSKNALEQDLAASEKVNSDLQEVVRDVQHKHTTAETALSHLCGRLEEQEATNKAFREANRRLEDELETVKAENEAISDELQDLRPVRNELERMIVQRGNLIQQVQELTGQREASEASRGVLEQDFAAGQKINSDLRGIVKDLQHRCAVAEIEVRDLGGQLEEQETTDKALWEANRRLEDELETVSAENQAINDEVQDLRAVRDEFERIIVQRKYLGQQVQELTGRLEASEASKNALEQGFTAGQKVNSDMQEAVKDLQHKHTVAETALMLRDLRGQLEGQEARNQDLWQANSRLEDEMKTLTAENQAINYEVRDLRAVRDEFERIIVQRKYLTQHVQELTDRLEASEASKNVLEQDSTAGQRVNSDMQEVVKELQHKYTIAETAVRDLRGKLEEQEARSKDLWQANGWLEDEVKTLTAENQAVNDEVQDLRAVRKEFEQVTVQHEKLTQQVQELTDRLEAGEASKNVLEQDFAAGQKVNLDLQEAAKDLQYRRTAADTELRDLRGQLEGQEARNQDLWQANSQLEYELETVSAENQAINDKFRIYRQSAKSLSR